MRISYSRGSTILNFWVLNFEQPFIFMIKEIQFSNDCLILKKAPMLWFLHCPSKLAVTTAPMKVYDYWSFVMVKYYLQHVFIIQSMKDL